MNTRMKRHLVSAILLLSLAWLGACVQIPETPTTDLTTATHPIRAVDDSIPLSQTATVLNMPSPTTQLLLTSTVLPTEIVLPSVTPVSTPELIKITSEYIAEDTERFYWSADSGKLIHTDSSGNSWAYNVITHEYTRVEPTPALEKLLPIPDTAETLGFSPSGQKALFFTPLEPTPTFPPNLDGEYTLPPVPASLWLWDQGQAHQVGEVFNCIRSTIWSPDEQFVVLWGHWVMACPNRLWVVSLTNATTSALFPLEEPPASVVPLQISPESKALLYTDTHEDTLRFLDLTLLETTYAYHIPDLLSGQWFDEQRALVLTSTVDSPFFTLSLFDRDEVTVTPFLNSKHIPELRRLFINPSIAIAPNREWLAFTTWQNTFSPKETLWILRLPPLK
jgi:hypothetical protein